VSAPTPDREPSPWPPLAGGLLLLGLAFALASAAEREREPAARAARGLPFVGAGSLVALDLLWLRADGLYRQGRWAEMAAAWETAGRIEPRLPDSWEYRGWHLAYNVAGESVDAAERVRWVVEGVRVLRDGLARNPGATPLREFLARTLRDRSRRWPDVRAALARAAGGVDPMDESVALHRRVLEDLPGDGTSRLSLADALVDRGMDAMRRAPADAAVPSAASDLEEAASLYLLLAAEAGPGGEVFGVIAREARTAAEAAGAGQREARLLLLDGSK
jgi:hypothetical protein